MKLFVITPIFNRKEFTRNYLTALRLQTTNDFKTIIVDDGSTDGSAEMVETEFPEAILLKEKGNLWWAEATNRGVRHALKQGATHIMTLNDDTLPEPDYIEKMLYWSKLKPRALLGALAKDAATDKIVFGGELRDWKTGRGQPLLDHLPDDQRFGLHEVDFFPGRGLLIPTQVFEKIGFFDSKNFPQTIADLDFTYRAKRNKFEIYCNYDARIKIFPNESAAVLLRNKRNLRNYYKHLFGKKGGGNIIWFSKCAIRNCPKRYLPFFLAQGLARRIFGYFT